MSEFTYANGALFCVFLTPESLGDRDDIAAGLTTKEMKSLGSGSGSRVFISSNPPVGTVESALLASERRSEAKPGLTQPVSRIVTSSKLSRILYEAVDRTKDKSEAYFRYRNFMLLTALTSDNLLPYHHVL